MKPLAGPAAGATSDLIDGASFAGKLAGFLIYERGYRPGTVPAAEALATASDIALTYTDGRTRVLVFIVDGQRTPGKRFTPVRDEVLALQQAIRDAEARTLGARATVVIHIIEILDGTGSPADTRGPELAGTGRGAPIRVSVVDPSAGAVWSTSRAEANFLTRVLSRPPIAPERVRAAAAIVDLPYRGLWITLALLAVMILIFGLEVLLGVDPPTRRFEPGYQTLVAFGAVSRDLVLGDGEWTRLLSMMMLHSGPLHLLFNGVALFIGGELLEPRLGRTHYLALFLISGVAGALTSIGLNPPNLVSVGASGAISGLFGAALVVALHYPRGATRFHIAITALQILVPSLLPGATAFFSAGGSIDYAAHLGGAVAGALYGAFLLASWPQAQPSPGHVLPAGIIIAAGLLGLTLALANGVELRRQFNIVASLPTGPRFSILQRTQGPQGIPYVTRYPNDPRGHILNAMVLYQSGRYADAEAGARRGLADRAMLRRFFGAELVSLGEAVQALATDAQGRRDEALEIARGACGDTAEVRTLLDTRSLCPSERNAGAADQP